MIPKITEWYLAKKIGVETPASFLAKVLKDDFNRYLISKEALDIRVQIELDKQFLIDQASQDITNLETDFNSPFEKSSNPISRTPV